MECKGLVTLIFPGIFSALHSLSRWPFAPRFQTPTLDRVDLKSSGRAVAMNLENLVASLQKTAFFTLEFAEDLSRNPERYRSILNGLLGDTLAEQKNALAIPMQLYGEAQGEKICLLVHGLFDTETTWQYIRKPQRDYGSLLEEEFGYQPLYLRYNTGLHISTNGQQLSRLLEKTFKRQGHLPQELILIGHSMGGLVIRSACHYAQKRRHHWVRQVKKIFFLGTPHLGSDWEKLGHITSIVLRYIPNLFTMGIASLGNQRSAGIKDLRYGYLVDEDWKGKNAKALFRGKHQPVPLMKNVDYYVIAATLAKKKQNLLTDYFGDGLVPLRSARGKSFRRSRSLDFDPKHFKAFPGLSHVALAHSSRVYNQIKKWL